MLSVVRASPKIKTTMTSFSPVSFSTYKRGKKLYLLANKPTTQDVWEDELVDKLHSGSLVKIKHLFKFAMRVDFYKIVYMSVLSYNLEINSCSKLKFSIFAKHKSGGLHFRAIEQLWKSGHPGSVQVCWSAERKYTFTGCIVAVRTLLIMLLIECAGNYITLRVVYSSKDQKNGFHSFLRPNSTQLTYFVCRCSNCKTTQDALLLL